MDRYVPIQVFVPEEDLLTDSHVIAVYRHSRWLPTADCLEGLPPGFRPCHSGYTPILLFRRYLRGSNRC